MLCYKELLVEAFRLNVAHVFGTCGLGFRVKP